MAFVSSRNLAYAMKAQRRPAARRMRVAAMYSGGGQLGDLAGFSLKKLGKGIVKGVAKGASATVKAVGAGAKTTVNATSSVAKFIPKAAAFTGKTAVDAAFLPSKTVLGLTKGIATSIASNAGKVAGGILKLPLDVGKSLGTGLISPFKSGGTGGGGELAPTVTNDVAAPTGGGGSAPSTSYGGGSSYDGGGGGGGGGSPNDLEQAKEQGLSIQETGMPLWQKLALGAVALVGAYFLYKKFARGGRSAGRSKSRR
jgi:hypothetical protein